MKYYFFTILFTVSLIINAQDRKGTAILGGTVSYSSQNTKNNANTLYERTDLLINPKVGFYISPNFILGFGGGIQKIENSEIDYTGINSSNLESEINLRFVNVFFNVQSPIIEKLKFNLNVDLKTGFGESKYFYPNFSSSVRGKLTETEFTIQPGLFYFLTKKIAISSSYGKLSYYTNEEEIDWSSIGREKTSYSFDETKIDLGIDSFRLGFMFVFSSNKQ
jgi:hypothetical protein